ncbi:M56 family metallopeptidase [Hymenobacter sp. 5414T-23]|uniref:M56 family metallopeptidase n=1 Tax=Hymenobacter sp. 5414T-23 TaxID=2932252 RepID=UPI001FD5C47D|nr:M56 family metallopeptidase [Hymenobacter sp. 5414T-23]UOQ79695.1 M56 family metallopeptidase [Hymenobacter sp. 5414T-23]
MNWLEQLLPPALIRALGWTLVHSLWQGAVVALALAGLLLLLQRHRAAVRYNTAAASLVALLVLAAITFGRYYAAARTEVQKASAVSAVTTETMLPAAPAVAAEQPAVSAAPASTAVAAVADVAPAAAPAPTGLQAWLTYFDQNLPVLVAAWLLGLLAMTLRLLGGLAYVQRLRRYRVQPLAAEWQERLSTLAGRAGLQQPIELLESALVRVPVVVGHLRPVVLLPLGTVTGLSQTYLEAILAHELAHVARRDYLVNLVQSVAETLFFYHPAVWFLTACLRTERENCCDDMATAMVGGNPLTVARALAALAELSAVPATPAQLALSALGPDGSVLGRIKRLVQGRTAPTFTEGFMAACVVLGGMVLLTSAVAMADPRPVGTDGKEGGALSKLPFLLAEPDTTLITATEQELVDVEAVEMPDVPEIQDAADLASSWQDNGDKDKKRRKRSKQVVVVQEGARRPGTIVIEKDKKGRLTDLYVNGRRVETASANKKSKQKGQEVEVIRVAPNGQVWSNATPGFDFRFNDNFSRVFTVPGVE